MGPELVDDSACSAKLPEVREWFDKLSELGPNFGYYPEPQKTTLVVDSKDQSEAEMLFGDLGVTVVTGQRFLGGFIGDHESCGEYVEQRVEMWMQCVEKLTKTAESQPQAAHVALTKSLQFEWSYLQRVVPNCAEAFGPLCNTINQKLLPTVLGGTLSEQEKILFSLPAGKGGGGLGIRDPVESAETAYSVSEEGTIKIVRAIRAVEELSVQEHREEMANPHAKIRVEQERDHMKLEAALEHLDAGKKHSFEST